MLKLEVPLIWSHNICMLNMKQELYTSLVNELLDKPTGLDIFCWIRRRTNAHHEQLWGSELEGSSDTSGYMFQLWTQYGEDKLGEEFGFWINGEIVDMLDLPRCKATEQYHNAERA